MNNTNDLKKIENLICKFYKVKSFSQLGVGKMKHLKELTNSNEEINESIIYFDSILNKSDSMSPTIDFIDNKENQAFLINKLNECPLLENIQIYLEQFIDLDGVDLKFVINNLKNKLNQEQIGLLEIEPGVLLKLSKNTDIDFIKQAIEQGDYVNACGHLVSLIAVKYKSLNQMPRSLLSMKEYEQVKKQQILQNKTIIKDLIMDNEMQEKSAVKSAKIDLECEKGI